MAPRSTTIADMDAQETQDEIARLRSRVHKAGLRGSLRAAIRARLSQLAMHDLVLEMRAKRESEPEP